ncbi:cytochrome P450 [Aureimonas psammosilenae]|uniref:cytochrome P450 n=1 Tax=Aureimonas psammosilenae TaxID=2495496 RepID=UPI002E25A811
MGAMETHHSEPLPDSLCIERSEVSLDPRDPSFFQNPYPAYRRLRELGDLFHWEEVGCRASARHAVVSALLRDRRFGRVLPEGEDGRVSYANKPDHTRNFYAIERHSLLDLEPPTHSRIRALVLKAFVSRQVERLEPRIARLANDLIDRFAAEGHAELVEDFATPLPVIVVAELIGVDPVHASSLLDWSHRMVAMYQFGRSEAVERAADEAAAEFSAFVREIIAAKRRRPGDDLISALIAAETERGSLSEDEMVSTVVLLMNAGHEATVHQIGNGMKAILQSGIADPQALFTDDTGAARCVEEVLRFDTPLHLFRRVALQDLTLGDGSSFHRGEEVALLLGAANRDAAIFAAPDVFDPTISRQAPTSFGAGIHFCVGAPLARLELRIALSILFRRLPGLKLAATPRYRDSWHFRGLERLDLTFEPTRQVLMT